MAKRVRKPKGKLPASKKPAAAAPGLTMAASGRAAKEAALPAEELEYRMLLQEAILWATKELMAEHREEILKLAKERVKTLKDLRG